MFGIKALEKLIESYKFNTVLDVGSGNGEHSKVFINKGKDVTSISLSKLNIPNITHIQEDFNIHEFNKKYDLVWASHVLEHQPNIRSFIQKLFSVCNDNGTVAITVPPMKGEIVGGHLTIWNAGLLMYNIISAGYSCKNAILLQYDYNISIIVDKSPIIVPSLNWDRGDILKLKEYFPIEVDEPFDGNMRDINWNSSIKKNKVQFLIPTPDKKYYLWQILVQITNFRDMGYEQDMHIPVIYFNNKPSDILQKLVNSKELKCHFHLFSDDRKDKSYSASMKPYMVYKYFKRFPEKVSDVYNYLDSDVVFTKPMNFEPFIHDDIWYGSGTKSYTGVGYIKSKGEKLFYEMCDICGVNPEMIIDNDELANIGAQYFIKNNTPELWKEIYEKSIPLYKHLNNTSKIYNPEKPIQKWTAEMWTTIYIALKHGYKLQKSDLMQFHWAKHKAEWESKPYFHDAGYIGKQQDGVHFCKLAFYNETPFNKELKVDKSSVSWNYVELIKKTEKVFPDLIF